MTASNLQPLTEAELKATRKLATGRTVTGLQLAHAFGAMTVDQRARAYAGLVSNEFRVQLAAGRVIERALAQYEKKREAAESVR